MDHLYAAEAVCRRLFLWLRGAWHGGPYEAASGQRFKRVTVLDDFSAGGLYLRLLWHVAVGAKLCVVVCLMTDSFAWAATPYVAVQGCGSMCRGQLDGISGVGVVFMHYQFL
jgi:hypothetical protein